MMDKEFLGKYVGVVVKQDHFSLIVKSGEKWFPLIGWGYDVDTAWIPDMMKQLKKAKKYVKKLIMDKKLYISEELWEFVDENLNITLPEEFKEGNYDHDNLDENRIDLELSGIRKGWKFELQDCRILLVRLAVLERTSDILDVRHIWALQEALPEFLENLYDTDKDNLQKLVESDNKIEVKKILDTIYFQTALPAQFCKFANITFEIFRNLFE